MRREGIVYRMTCHTCGAGVDNRAAPCVCDQSEQFAGPRGTVITRNIRTRVDAVAGSFDHDHDAGE